MVFSFYKTILIAYLHW